MNLEVRKANLETDLPEINSWYEQWKTPRVPDWWYPEDNYVIDGVIFASYYKTNSKLVFLENVISNPNCPSEIRKAGLGLIGEHIFSLAKEQGFKAVIGTTTNHSVADNAKDHGMKVSKREYIVLAKFLGDD